MDDNEACEIHIGNKPDIKPDVGKPVMFKQDLLSLDLPPVEDVCLAPSTLDTEQPSKRKKKRNKRGRPPMTVAQKKAAKKAKATTKAAAAPKSAVKTAPVMSKMSSAVETRVMEFEPREGTHRKRLLIALCSSVNKHVRVVDLQTSLYGEINDASKSALNMVLKGAAATIATKKLKYSLERGANGDGETTVILRAK